MPCAIIAVSKWHTPSDGDLPVMREVITRIDVLGELINDLMLFARPRPPRPETVELRLLIEEAIAMLSRDPIGTALEMAPPLIASRADLDEAVRVAAHSIDEIARERHLI